MKGGSTLQTDGTVSLNAGQTQNERVKQRLAYPNASADGTRFITILLLVVSENQLSLF
jgi:hypothetical protein